MSNETPQPVLADSTSQPRRRSMRLSSPNENVPNSAPTDAVKRRITVRKIAPRKTQVNVPSEEHTENEQRLLEGSRKKSQIYTPGPAQVPPPKATMLSPILAPSPPCPQAAANPEDSAWSQKVRRSYTRLSLGDPSFESHQAVYSPSPQRRETLFGFEKLQTPQVLRKVEQFRVGPEASRSLCGVSSFTLLEVDNSAAAAPDPEPDVNIPGVAVVKEKKRSKKVPQIKLAELDDLAAKMNAEFEEAEGFELLVE
ncbi:sororin-like isoform X1 [Salvelinus namaycush]|uniref:Sororin-like isoform X1 n=2 Tax=Salvelinus namaycush TaxID=8040 RepID=A0A8U1BQF6_SALNM|nr:sororin-like isoform X1 [Salvelinus namaycush]